MTTGQIVKHLRGKKGITQEQLAEMLGYSHKSSITKIELDKADLPQSKLIKLAKIFDVSPCELLGYESIPATDEQFNFNQQLKNEAALFEHIQKLYGKNAVKVLQLFNSLNNIGKKKAIENIEDLTAVPKYQKEDLSNEEV